MDILIEQIHQVNKFSLFLHLKDWKNVLISACFHVSQNSIRCYFLISVLEFLRFFCELFQTFFPTIFMVPSFCFSIDRLVFEKELVIVALKKQSLSFLSGTNCNEKFVSSLSIRALGNLERWGFQHLFNRR